MSEVQELIASSARAGITRIVFNRAFKSLDAMHETGDWNDAIETNSKIQGKREAGKYIKLGRSVCSVTPKHAPKVPTN